MKCSEDVMRPDCVAVLGNRLALAQRLLSRPLLTQRPVATKVCEFVGHLAVQTHLDRLALRWAHRVRTFPRYTRHGPSCARRPHQHCWSPEAGSRKHSTNPSLTRVTAWSVRGHPTSFDAVARNDARKHLT